MDDERLVDIEIKLARQEDLLDTLNSTVYRQQRRIDELEALCAALAKRVAEELTIPVIGIGAGPDVDGQVLVVHDMLGLTKEFKPRFLRRYAELHDVMTEAVQHYVADVKNREFPSKEEGY